MQRRRFIYSGVLMLCMIVSCASCAQNADGELIDRSKRQKESEFAESGDDFDFQEDSSSIVVTYQVVGDGAPDSDDMSDTVYKLQQRVGIYGSGAIVYQEGTDRIKIEIPDDLDVNTILEELVRPGALYFIAQTDSEGNSNYAYTYSTDENGRPMYMYALSKPIEELLENGSIIVTGMDIADAKASTQKNPVTGSTQYVVSLTLTEDGARAFADATIKALAARESIAIYYDGEFVSVPTVAAAITDGHAVITGQSTLEEAERLASVIRIGSLKLELELVEEINR